MEVYCKDLSRKHKRTTEKHYPIIPLISDITGTRNEALANALNLHLLSSRSHNCSDAEFRLINLCKVFHIYYGYKMFLNSNRESLTSPVTFR